MKNLHIELNNLELNNAKIIIDACEIFGEYEIMAMLENGEELECRSAKTEKAIIELFDAIVYKYANPLQKLLYKKLEKGKRYTLVFFSREN